MSGKIEQDSSNADIYNDIVDDGIIIYDASGTLRTFSISARKILGITSKNVIGLKVGDIVKEPRVLKLFDSMAGDEQLLEHINGNDLFLRKTVISDGREEKWIVITLRVSNEAHLLLKELVTLREVNERMNWVLSSIRDGIQLVNEDGICIYVNKAYTELTGYLEQDIIGKTPSLDIQEGKSMLLQVLRTRQPQRNTQMVSYPSKKKVLVDATPIIIDRRLKGAVAMIQDVSEINRLSKELTKAKRVISNLRSRYTFDDIIGKSNKITEVIEKSKAVASTSATVLLQGESGTGKELLAHAIHHYSPRSSEPFIKVNCAAIPDTLMESELFGYVGGAFTGGKQGGHKGYFIEANRGTIFLDEISEMTPGAQVKLLRVLQEQEVLRLGDAAPVPIDVRIIAASNADLVEMIDKNLFREDLYYRINVIPITVPPLSDRIEDIPLLVDYLIYKINQEYDRNIENIADEAMQVLTGYRWPGNIRELENVIRNTVINMNARETVIEPYHLPGLNRTGSDVLEAASGLNKELVPGNHSLSELKAGYEKRIIASALENCNGNRAMAARLLKTSERNLYKKIKLFKLNQE